jgi:hypothetical protein
MASISDPVPLPLNLSSQTAKVHATAVLNCKNEAVVAIDGEGLFIHSVLILCRAGWADTIDCSK